MKIERQLPSVTTIQPQDRRQTHRSDAPAPQPRQPAGRQALAERMGRHSSSFNIQLNRQLSSMQLAERYLTDLEGRLAGLKLSLSRMIGSAEPEQRAAAQQALQQVNELLQQRMQRAGGAVDAGFKLSLNEPLRIRFSLQGLESMQAIQRAGAEILVFSGGRQLPEPLAVVLEEGLSEQQILRRFNASLGQAGLRAELGENGQLLFSARESDWQALRGQLAVQGEGKLFPKEQRSRIQSQEEQLLHLPAELKHESVRELRQTLDSVLAALDKVSHLREQLAKRQQEIREFLARHADDDEEQWARDYASTVFNVMNRQPASYAAVIQTVMAQANISRFAVVSLLS